MSANSTDGLTWALLLPRVLNLSTDSGPFVAALEDPRVTQLLHDHALPSTYRDDLRGHIVPVLPAISRRAVSVQRPLLLGLNGSQGSGKSTLARFLKVLLEAGSGLRTTVLSLDDFYLSKAQREDLVKAVHPLLKTRGVPGTHDVELANNTLNALIDPVRDTLVPLPAFDKATDDRKRDEQWPLEQPQPDIILLEGWCVGCPPQPRNDLLTAVNDLENTADPKGMWRRYVNHCLAHSYRQLFARLDILMLLQVPGFHCVYEWRAQQEHQLAVRATQQSGSNEFDHLMDADQLRVFISHFQRLTEYQLAVLPARCDITIGVDEAHRWISHECRLPE